MKKWSWKKTDNAMLLGFLAAALTAGPIHESGHYLAAKVLGYKPSFGFLDNLVFSLGVHLDKTTTSIFDDNIISLGAPAAELTAAFALSLASNKIKNTLLKYTAKVTSTFLGFTPFINASISYFSLQGDYQRLADNGISYAVTMPVTLAMGLINTYPAYKSAR